MQPPYKAVAPTNLSNTYTTDACKLFEMILKKALLLFLVIHGQAHLINTVANTAGHVSLDGFRRSGDRHDGCGSQKPSIP